MKYILLTVLSLITSGNSNVDTPPFTIREECQLKPVKSILVIGDSQSAVVTADGKKISWTWPNLLQNQLKNCGTKIDVVALGGKTTEWMLLHGRKKLQNTDKYDRVIIYGGGNDACNMSIHLDTTISNIQKLIDLALLRGSDVWVNLGWKIEGKFMDINVLPVGRPANLLKKRSDWLPYIERRKQLQKLLKERLTGCQFIEPYDLMSLTNDGIHPTSSGHKLVCEYILQTIDTTLCD